MLVKIFSLKFDPLLGGFDDTTVHNFIQDKEVLQIQDHLLVRSEIPYLVLIVKYYPYRSEAEARAPGKDTKEQKQEEWRKEITEADMPLFNRLRDWRSERCKKDGVPPYVVFTNQQLAMIVKQKPQSLAELVQIEGVGKGKSERYGADILQITGVKPDG